MRYRCARCDWQSEDPDATAGHAELHPRCVLCGLSLKPDEQQTCTEDLGRVRANLRDIADWCALLPPTLGRLGSNAPRREATHHGDGSERLPGGDALVMLAGASERRWGAANEGHPSDPPAVAFELWTWADDWRTVRHEDQDPPVTVTELARWLSGDRWTWVASWHRPEAVVPFAEDMARIRAALVRATGTSTAPETREARCINLDCSGCDTVKLERGYSDDGRADYWSCPRCRRQYGQHGYHLALAACLARRGVVA